MNHIRSCRRDESKAIHAIINAAAEAYRDVIPEDCWHDPYMSMGQLESDIAAGVSFAGYETDGVLIGVMGTQPVRDVDLIRHAYVLPGYQHHGVGSGLILHLRGLTHRQMLVGTWAAADWAIRFYQRHGFELASPEQQAGLLSSYWTLSDRQIATSVVLANPPLSEA